MRFLKEDPWARLAQFREAMPNLLLQMLLRSANRWATPIIRITWCGISSAQRE